MIRLSLVGTEICMRDSPCSVFRVPCSVFRVSVYGFEPVFRVPCSMFGVPASYTKLMLPTKLDQKAPVDVHAQYKTLALHYATT